MGLKYLGTKLLNKMNIHGEIVYFKRNMNPSEEYSTIEDTGIHSLFNMLSVGKNDFYKE